MAPITNQPRVQEHVKFDPALVGNGPGQVTPHKVDGGFDRQPLNWGKNPEFKAGDAANNEKSFSAFVKATYGVDVPPLSDTSFWETNKTLGTARAAWMEGKPASFPAGVSVLPQMPAASKPEQKPTGPTITEPGGITGLGGNKGPDLRQTVGMLNAEGLIPQPVIDAITTIADQVKTAGPNSQFLDLKLQGVGKDISDIAIAVGSGKDPMPLIARLGQTLKGAADVVGGETGAKINAAIGTLPKSPFEGVTGGTRLVEPPTALNALGCGTLEENTAPGPLTHVFHPDVPENQRNREGLTAFLEQAYPGITGERLNDRIKAYQDAWNNGRPLRLFSATSEAGKPVTRMSDDLLAKSGSLGTFFTENPPLQYDLASKEMPSNYERVGNNIVFTFDDGKTETVEGKSFDPNTLTAPAAPQVASAEDRKALDAHRIGISSWADKDGRSWKGDKGTIEAKRNHDAFQQELKAKEAELLGSGKPLAQMKKELEEYASKRYMALTQ